MFDGAMVEGGSVEGERREVVEGEGEDEGGKSRRESEGACC
jgi:hypothetical protein